MPQVIHRPTIFDDDKSDPFGVVPDEQDNDPQNERDSLDDPKDHIEDLLVTGLRLVVGDILQKFPHGFLGSVHGDVVMRTRTVAASILLSPRKIERRKI